MFKLILPIVLVSFVAAVPIARAAMDPQKLNIICRHGHQARRISIQYDQAGKAVPCHVIDAKDDGAEGKTLWSAKVKEGYCESKAQDFAQKLQTFGWKCSDAGKSKAPAKTSE